ncbi:MAG TPA: oxidoreductase-like domain-containing protein [Burkholderiaceae bacterium]|nr:oxidoreductase-like domain-containing protein [Burkholderiaceae bacterium]
MPSGTPSPPKKPAQDPRPLAPRRPGNDECCGNGCIPCIFDIYEDQLERYREQLAAWEKRQRRPPRATTCRAHAPDS